MISLERQRSGAVIDALFLGARRQELAQELLTNQRRIKLGEITTHPWQSDRWKRAKDQLSAETGGKCAYCEAPTTQVAYGDVEHYRPKSTYWWLAYCYENYLVSCALCNQKYKRAKFPVKNGKMRAPVVRCNTTDAFISANAATITPDSLDPAQVDAFHQRHIDERPLLLNPYYDDPEQFFAWHADGVKREVELIPMPGNPDAEAYYRAAVKYYGLNRKKLREYRWGQYRLYWTFRLVLEDAQISPPTQAAVRATVEGMKQASAPYAGMIRYFDKLSFDQLPQPVEPS